MLTAGKEYVVLIRLHKCVEEKKIRAGVEKFLGKIIQLPPVRSAVKRQERVREIYYAEILEIEKRDVLMKVGCQAGTYIRKLAHDLGKKLGVGAHMAQLVRTKAGPFTDKTWRSLQDVKDAYIFFKEGDDGELKKIILPFEAATEHLPKIWILDSAVSNVCHGASLGVRGISKFHSGISKHDVVAVRTLKNELVCLGEARLSSEEIRDAERGIAVTDMKVFMDRDVYPRVKK